MNIAETTNQMPAKASIETVMLLQENKKYKCYVKHLEKCSYLKRCVLSKAKPKMTLPKQPPAMMLISARMPTVSSWP